MKKHTNYLEDKIFSLREQIDFVDSTILDLINLRLNLAENIGRLKREGCRCVTDDVRETQVLSRLKVLNKGLLESNFLCDIFSNIIAASRAIQMKISRSSTNLFDISLSISDLDLSYAAFHSLIFVNVTIKIDCSYFLNFLITSKGEIYTEYHSQVKYGLIMNISNSGVVYIYGDLSTHHHNWSQRCISSHYWTL